MFDYLRDVGAFHAKFGLDGLENPEPGFMDPELQKFRLGFMLEELLEYAEAVGFYMDIKLEDDGQGGKTPSISFVVDPEGTKNLEKALDALIDGQYVLGGTARFHGFAQYRYDGMLGQRLRVFDAGWFRVQKANLSKVRAMNKQESKRASPYDVVKPVGWKAPTFEDLLA